MKIKNLWQTQPLETQLLSSKQEHCPARHRNGLEDKTLHSRRWEQETHGENKQSQRVGTVGVGEDAGKQKACASPQLGAQETSYA